MFQNISLFQSFCCSKCFNVAVASVLSGYCICVSRILQLHIPHVSSIFEIYVALKCFILYGESGASTNGVRRASGCGHDILEVGVGGHSGAQVPLWGRHERMGDGGRGCGACQACEGHCDGSWARVQCIRNEGVTDGWALRDNTASVRTLALGSNVRALAVT